MGPKVLGRITASTDRPRGPDVLMTLSVPDAWIADGATLEIEVPRNLACAACGGGGCDVCERSGAVSLRGRQEPAETVEITLPKALTAEDPASGKPRVVVVRIPDRGGLPAEGLELPRGNLLLSVRPGEELSRGVTRLAQPSMPPPPPVEIVSAGAVSTERVDSNQRAVRLAWAVAAIVLFLILWWFRR